MHSLASAVAILNLTSGIDSTGPLLKELGFSEAVPIIDDNLASLGFSPAVQRPSIAQGKGALRAMVFELAGSADLRNELSKAAARLASAVPEMLWVLIAINEKEIAVAAFDVSAARPRVAALIATRGRIIDSDAESLCALAAASCNPDALAHSRYLEILGRESVSAAFFRTLQSLVGVLATGLSPSVDALSAHHLSLLYTSRLIFLCFLETKGWMDRDHGFLGNRFADCMVGGGGYHRRVLQPLFFGTLNTHPRKRAPRARGFGRIPFLNGGLFSRSPLEAKLAKSFFSDESLGDLFGDLLSRYRFTAREDTSSFSQAAVDPEMLGKAFEGLMSASDRKTSGAFYTPQSLVAEVSSKALGYGLSSRITSDALVASALAGDIPSPSVRNDLLESIKSLRIIDPACGSGAFLVHVLEQMSRLRVRLGDLRPLHSIRREILTSNIFGVDINPTAVWLCELRLWLSMAIEDPEIDPLRVTPLPNLDRNIRVGDSLSGDSFARTIVRRDGRRVAAARTRYTRATGSRKQALARVLDRMERDCAVATAERRITRAEGERREILAAARARDLFGHRHPPGKETTARLVSLKTELREQSRVARQLAQGGALPFSFPSSFADVESCGGFNVVIGNPPWIRIHNMNATSRAVLRDRYSVYRNAAWTAGSQSGSVSRGFASQVDSSALFIERSIDLLKPGGTAAVIVPAKLWRSLAGGGVRSLLMERTRLRDIHDLSEAASVFDAAVYPSVIVASNDRVGSEDLKRDSSTTAVTYCAGNREQWRTWQHRLRLDDTTGSPWIVVPDDVRTAFDLLKNAGTSFADSPVGRPLLGVKTGCNDAFIKCSPQRSADGVARIDSKDRAGSVETRLLRPLVRGETLARWSADHRETIIWTHDAHDDPLENLPEHAKNWLGQWRRELMQRSDARGKARWWMLFRTESADSSLPRVLWSDLGRNVRAAALEAGDPAVPLNSCYASRCKTIEDAYTLAALLNSEIISAWLRLIAEPARGGYKRYLGWTMSLLPLPSDWCRARTILAPLGRRATIGDALAENDLLAAALEAYGLTQTQVQPLLDWNV